jgi:hypothetical protein
MTPSTLPTVRRAIVIILDHNEIIEGTETLATELNLLNNKGYVIRSARILQDAGEITIIPSRGGRGLKTVYKRNRNQPGLPRRKR